MRRRRSGGNRRRTSGKSQINTSAGRIEDGRKSRRSKSRQTRRHSGDRSIRRRFRSWWRMSFKHFPRDGFLRFRSISIEFYFDSPRLHHHPRTNLTPIRFRNRINSDDIPILRFPIPPLSIVLLPRCSIDLRLTRDIIDEADPADSE